jgi:hypothetical protein
MFYNIYFLSHAYSKSMKLIHKITLYGDMFPNVESL